MFRCKTTISYGLEPRAVLRSWILEVPLVEAQVHCKKPVDDEPVVDCMIVAVVVDTELLVVASAGEHNFVGQAKKEELKWIGNLLVVEPVVGTRPVVAGTLA